MGSEWLLSEDRSKRDSTMALDLDRLFRALRSGDKRAGGLTMSLIDDEDPQSEDILKRLYQSENRALAVGITGWPGVGKSSLISRLAKAFLDLGRKVGIIAVDPTSPFTGGSLLGDRIRFRDIEGNSNLYIRSVASRGHHGGLSRSARAFIKVMEVMGYEIVLVETVGIGQDQIGVSLIVDTTVVVVAPGLGDYLQAIKSGVIEIGDIFVVNKGDRDGADRAVGDLQNAIMMREKEDWRPPVVKTVAIESRGIKELMVELDKHAAYSAADRGAQGRKSRAAKDEVVDAIKTRLFDHFFGGEGLRGESMAEYTRQIRERKTDPYTVADGMLRNKGIS
jgi:LAO/AO transport system kinase